MKRFNYSETDSERLVAIAAGNPRAFEELYVDYHRRLARFLLRFTRCHENIEEIINDTFMVVWRTAGDFRRGIAGVELDFRHCLSHGTEIDTSAKSPLQRSKLRRVPRTSGPDRRS